MKTALALIVVVVVVIAGYFLFATKTQAPVTTQDVNPGNSAPTETATPNPTGTTTTTTSINTTVTATAAKTVTVTYNGSTFSPASVTIKKGDSVKFVDTSSSPMWIASNPHPTHQGYSGTTASQHCPDTTGTAFDQCSAGSSYTFTFQKVGSWGYHNHANHSVTGTVVVTQ
jgi:plastocyanin